MQTKIKEAYDALLAKEYDSAFTLYTQLAEEKEPTSFYYLGFLYFRGFGVEQDSKKAYDNYLAAATREVPVAKFEVALMLENGEGC
jgi:TPR repeat protein